MSDRDGRRFNFMQSESCWCQFPSQRLPSGAWKLLKVVKILAKDVQGNFTHSDDDVSAFL